MLINDPPVEITDGLWMLGTNEYPVYLLKGEQQAAIFEGGTGAMGPLVREQLEKLPIEVAAVKQLIIPHAHPDHVMSVPLFREMFPDITVAASGPAVKTLMAEKAVALFCKLDEALTGALIEAGLIGEQHRPQPLAEKQIPVDRVVKEGDTVTIDGLSFDVLETPGHSDCSLSFHEPGRKLLFISDATGYFMPKFECWWPNYFVDYGTNIDSMKRLADLDAEILCLGHHAAITGVEDVKTYFRDAIAATEQYHRNIVEQVNSGKTVRQVAEQLGADVHDKMPLFPLDFFQKNCALLAKNSLKHEGMETPADSRKS